MYPYATWSIETTCLSRRYERLDRERILGPAVKRILGPAAVGHQGIPTAAIKADERRTKNLSK